MKNTLYFIFKALFVLGKTRLISKFITSQPSKQTITIRILTNISRCKSNQAMKFGQLIEYNMRNIFLEKLYSKCGGETIARLVSKRSKLSISLDQQSKVLHSLFLFYACQAEDYLNILKLSCRGFTFTSYKAFSKNKKRSWTSLPALFSAWFMTKYISLVIFYYLTKCYCLVAFTTWDVGQYIYCNCLLTKLWRHKFSNQPYLSNQASFSTWPKSQDKNLNISRTERVFKIK